MTCRRIWQSCMRSLPGKKAQWENEKSSVDRLSALREEIEQVNRDIATAQQQYDLNKAAELQYGRAAAAAEGAGGRGREGEELRI